MRPTYDAVVVGSGPNGLAGALTLARAGLRVEVLEAASQPGGGCRTDDATLPGSVHDRCSAVHPLLAASPFFNGPDGPVFPSIELLEPEIAFGHPLDDGRCATVERSLEATASRLGRDRSSYAALLGPLVDGADDLVADVLQPLRSLPGHPGVSSRFAARAIGSASGLVRRFHDEEARALFAGTAAHASLPLGAPLTAGYALLLTVLAHSVGWPVVRGGSQRITDAMLAELDALGSSIRTGHRVDHLGDLPDRRAVLLDVSVDQLPRLMGRGLGRADRFALDHFRAGPGVCKVDWLLDGPVPWTAGELARTATVHLGGTFEEIAAAEAEVASGVHPARPFVIATQPCVVDPDRAPGGAVLWAYCHVPYGSDVDMTDRIEAQIERFAPGFRDRVIARTTRTAVAMGDDNPNERGGDITGGAGTLRQSVLRPFLRWRPYATGMPGVYLCSSSTAPGGGVHGMCGMLAAKACLKDLGASVA